MRASAASKQHYNTVAPALMIKILLHTIVESVILERLFTTNVDQNIREKNKTKTQSPKRRTHKRTSKS